MREDLSDALLKGSRLARCGNLLDGFWEFFQVLLGEWTGLQLLVLDQRKVTDIAVKNLPFAGEVQVLQAGGECHTSVTHDTYRHQRD